MKLRHHAPQPADQLSQLSSESASSDISGSSYKAQVVIKLNYAATNLVTEPNTPINEITCGEVLMSDITTRAEALLRASRDVFFHRRPIDPKQALKAAKQRGPAYTLIDYDLVASLAQFAAERHMRDHAQDQPSEPQSIFDADRDFS
jgi:hypothetical protein